MTEPRIKTHLESIVEVANFAEVVKELVDASLVVLHKGVEGHHIRFFGVRGLICQVLQHLGDLKPMSETETYVR